MLVGSERLCYQNAYGSVLVDDPCWNRLHGIKQGGHVCNCFTISIKKSNESLACKVEF
jgi:hypothetical protein